MGKDKWASLVAQALIDLMDGSNPAASLFELEELAKRTRGYGFDGPVSGPGVGTGASGKAQADPVHQEPLEELERRWNLVAGSAEEAHRQKRGDASLDALAALLEIVSTGLHQESEWRRQIPDPSLAGPDALAGYFRRSDSLEAPGARRFLAALRVQKVGGRDPRRKTLSMILDALDVSTLAAHRQRRVTIEVRLRWLEHVTKLLKEANRATTNSRTEDEIRTVLDRGRPGFGWNAPLARALAQRRDPVRRLRRETEPFQVMAIRLIAEMDGLGDGLEPSLELGRLMKAGRREKLLQKKKTGTRT